MLVSHGLENSWTAQALAVFTPLYSDDKVHDVTTFALNPNSSRF